MSSRPAKPAAEAAAATSLAPPELFLPGLVAVLLTVATLCVLTQERGVAQAFGFPVDSGWTDLGLAKQLSVGEGLDKAWASEGVGHLAVLTVLHRAFGRAQGQTILLAKLLSLFALWINFKISV